MDIALLSKTYKDAGIVGAGGAGFPSYAKLNDKAETLLLNCAECEPLLRLHRQLMTLCAKEILEAFDLTRETLGAKEGIICLKSHYTDAIKAVESELGNYPKLKICKLDAVYPAGDEVVMIYEATGKVVRPGGLPIECGVIVYNVETMYNAYRALKEKPLTDKLVTVAGEVKSPITVRVPIGAKLKDVVDMAGGVTTDDYVYWVGGPMMGVIKGAGDVVTKTTNSVFVLPPEHYLLNRLNSELKIEIARAAASCCQCQLCTDLCPRHNLGHPIEPHKIMRAAACNNFSDVKAFMNTFYCCSCGVCELYSCPQGLSPRKLINLVKGGLRSEGIKPDPTVKAGEVEKNRPYRKVPITRLIARLGVSGYEAEAPLDNKVRAVDEVKIMCSQHIGAPAVPCVKQGDKVTRGDAVALAKEGALSVNIHASICGLVTEVNEKFITIKAMR